MNTRSARSLGGIVVIAGFVLSCFGLLLFLWLAFGGPIPLAPKGYRVQVAFPDAATLANQADVRISGVTVGKVVKRELAPGGNRTLATLELDDEYAPIRSDTEAVLRQKTLLGEIYVELGLGRSGRPVEEGGRLPDGVVAEAVEFDELLRTFDARTRRDLQQWQERTRAATAGREEEISDALGNLPTFADSGETLMRVLGDELDALRGVVRDTGTTFAALSRDAAALQGTIRGSDRVLGTLAARREALAESIEIFPTFLDETRLTLTRMARFAEDTDPLVRDLDPVLDDLQPTLASLERLGPDAERLFEDLPALIRAGRSGLPALSRVFEGLDPTLASVGPLLQNLNPVLEFLELYQATVSNFINIAPSSFAVRLATPPGSKTNGHVLGQQVVMGEQMFPHEQRSESNRGNAYFPPDGLKFTEQAGEFLTPPSWDCEHVGITRPSSGLPGCYLSEPVPFMGLNLKYPHVIAGRPGGLTTRPPGS